MRVISTTSSKSKGRFQGRDVRNSHHNDRGVFLTARFSCATSPCDSKQAGPTGRTATLSDGAQAIELRRVMGDQETTPDGCGAAGWRSGSSA